MYRIDNATATLSIPSPAVVGPNPNGFFTKGNPGLGVPATVVDDDWANAVQEEIAAVIEGAGITLNKSVRSQLLTAVRSLTRIKLTASTNFYVSSTGNDSTGDGSSGNPWLTIQHAINALTTNYDFGGFQQTISVGAGTFAGFNLFGPIPGQAGLGLIVSGAGMGTTFINSIVNCGYAGFLYLQNVTISNAAGSCVVASEYGRISVASINLAGCAAAAALLRAQVNGTLQITGNITISGGGGYALYAETNGTLFSNVVTVTVTGTPNFSSAFVCGTKLGAVNTSNLTFVGGATGVRYAASLNGFVADGGGANYFPGNSAGSTATGGQYG